MSERDPILPEENQELIRSEVLRQMNELTEKVTETNWKLTQHNFISNAGGAIAILGFLGTDNAGSWAIYPLLIFAIGLVSSTIEVRALHEVYSELHKAVSANFANISGRDFTAQDAMPEKGTGKLPGTVNKYASYISQACFILGVVCGGGGYVFTL